MKNHPYFLKIVNAQEKIAQFSRVHREVIFKESLEEFAKRLNEFSIKEIHVEDLVKLESGKMNIELHVLMAIWAAVQNLDSILEVAKGESAVFLASVQHMPDIEKHIMDNLPKT